MALPEVKATGIPRTQRNWGAITWMLPDRAGPGGERQTGKKAYGLC